ncbi:membrane protein insertase YidC [[Mycoplasma] anseris]|uniref:Membrane protein insertase YidC n=1 Tax=[Mycoplasma] anseris TaxID=92400 RepID=A0A2Z4NDF9_9BACT|nr:membrane protein insertase YidC [[Mycoplasma] anseris]AWX69623.1 membrane protein insertase YidC [[Mycoplasma] anseris]
MAKNKKSIHYNDFKATKYEAEKTPKSVWLKVWKWLKIVLIVIFATVGLVGCVQSFTIKTSNKVGAGYELYVKDTQLSPNVYTLKYDETTNTFSSNNDNKNIRTNTFLGKDSPETIEKLKSLNEEAKGNYLNYNGGSFALQLVADKTTTNSNNETTKTEVNVNDSRATDKGYVYNNGTDYVFFNLGDKDGNHATTVYKPVTEFSYIAMPSIEFFQATNEDNSETRTLNNRIKAVNVNYVAKDLVAGYDLKDLFARDVYQILINETLKKWEENNTYRINDILKPYTGANVLEKIDAFIADLKTKISADINDDKGIKSSDDYKVVSPDGKVTVNIPKDAILGTDYNNFVFSLSRMIMNYNNLFNIASTSKTYKDGELYQMTKISSLGNYYSDNSLKGFIKDQEIIPQKPIVSYGDYWKQGPFYGMFVYPIYQFMHAIFYGLGTTGWSIILALIITVILVRLITFFISFKSLFRQSKMEELNKQKAKIEAKYADYKDDKKMQQRKQMEISDMYKKAKISPFGQFVTMLITFPILIVVFRIISASPDIKSADWYGIQLSASSISRVIQGKEYIYLPLIIFACGIQALAQYLPKILAIKKNKALRMDAYQKQAMKKENRKSNIISLVFIFFGVLFSAGLQIYWIISGIWTIGQTLFVHYFQRSNFFKKKIEPRFLK